MEAAGLDSTGGPPAHPRGAPASWPSHRSQGRSPNTPSQAEGQQLRSSPLDGPRSWVGPLSEQKCKGAQRVPNAIYSEPGGPTAPQGRLEPRPPERGQLLEVTALGQGQPLGAGRGCSPDPRSGRLLPTLPLSQNSWAPWNATA